MNMEAHQKETEIAELKKEIERLRYENEQLRKELSEVEQVAQWALKKVYGER